MLKPPGHKDTKLQAAEVKIISFLMCINCTVINYFITESAVIKGKSQTVAFPYWPGDSKVNTASPRFEIFL